ncbi:MAG: Mur ligase family protein [Patescibacteria group bacterium]
MKKLIAHCLNSCAKRVLARAKPFVIGITGSVGKTSAKEAIGTVLKGKFSVRVSPKNYNNELGLPLAVLGLPAGGKSPLRWLSTFNRASWRSMFGIKDYPKNLVLEMGVDRPGDLARLLDVVTPSIGVVTTVGEAHAEFLGSLDDVAEEKSTLVKRLPKDGWAVLNADDARVLAMRNKTKAAVMTFGFAGDADVRAHEMSMSYTYGDERGEAGMHFKMAHKGNMVPIFLPEILGRQGVYAALAAAAVGLLRGMNLIEISDRLREFQSPPGRMRSLPGIKWTMIIDDTYNSSPVSAVAALDVLREIPLADGAKRIAVLGDMLELGQLSEDGHKRVGAKAAECADLLVFVGERMGDAETAALAAGAARDRTFHFGSVEEAGHFVQDRMKKGDVILVKGSQGMRMEKVVKEIMADPLSASKLLVRQEADWQ